MPPVARLSCEEAQVKFGPEPGQQIAPALLDWYDRHRRVLPWRALPGETADPYRVWLSEIMLQQTTVAAVGPYFQEFTARWPRVEDLAAEELDRVLTAWAGLGYYARARNLHKCAQTVAEAYGGVFPDTEEGLRELPGIGQYTAAAIAAIAFGRPATVVDGNVERVVSRLFALETPLPKSKPEIKRLAAGLTPQERPGDYAQAMMDLGATVCLPRKPRCLTCPIAEPCQARATSLQEELPRKKKKAERPTRRAVAFWTVNAKGEILLRRRPPKGLLGGMMEIPSTEWRQAAWSPEEALAQAPGEAEWRELPGLVRHTFTHFHFEITVWAGRAYDMPVDNVTFWCSLEGLADQALPSVMRKIVDHAVTETLSP